VQSSSSHDSAARHEVQDSLAQRHSYLRLTAGRHAVVLAYVLVGASYFYWRPSVFNVEAAAFSAALYAVELTGFLCSLLLMFVSWRLSHRVASAPPTGLTVDVLVQSGDAPPAVLERTLIAARDMAYPHATWLLDDDNRPELGALARKLGVRYQGRTSEATARTLALQRGGAAFVALFDAGDIPAHGFLQRTLGFFRDEDVAFVQTARACAVHALQRECTAGSQLVSHDESWSVRVLERGRDYWNASLFGGSCVVIRRTALEKVAEWGVGATADETSLSLRLHALGYQSVHAGESLAISVLPRDLGKYLEEEQRRSRTVALASLRDGLLFRRGLTLPQRLCYLQLAMDSAEGWRKLFLCLVPIIALTTGVLPVAAFDRDLLLHFAPYFVLQQWAFAETGRGFARSLARARLDMARVSALLAAPSGRGVADLAQRLWVILGFSLVAVCAGAVLDVSSTSLPLLALWALANAGLAAATLFEIRAPSLTEHDSAVFPLPLPARIKFPIDEPVYGLIDHISSTGFHFHGLFPEYAQFGATTTGELYLPGGPLPFTGKLRAFHLGQTGKGERFAKSVGLSFDWVGAPRDQVVERLLDALALYSRIMTLVESRPTPVERLQRVLMTERVSSHAGDWAPALIRMPSGSRVGGAIGMLVRAQDPGERSVLLTFAPIPERSRSHIAVVGRAARHTHIGAVERWRVIETPLGALYAYRFADERREGSTIKPQPSPESTRHYARRVRRGSRRLPY
jgi:cellulose synthase (UDP-forming)